jgi:hypothetical protein
LRILRQSAITRLLPSIMMLKIESQPLAMKQKGMMG